MFKYLLAKNEDIPAGSAAVYFGFSSIVWFVIGTGLERSMPPSWPSRIRACLEFVSFGHMRQVHVHAVIFGWISMAFAMAMMYITPALGTPSSGREARLVELLPLERRIVARPHAAVVGNDLGTRILRLPLVYRPLYSFFMAIPLGVNVWMTIINRRTRASTPQLVLRRGDVHADHRVHRRHLPGTSTSRV